MQTCHIRLSEVLPKAEVMKIKFDHFLHSDIGFCVGLVTMMPAYLTVARHTSYVPACMNTFSFWFCLADRTT